MVTARAALTPPTNGGFEGTAMLPFPLKTHLEGRSWSADYVLK